MFTIEDPMIVNYLPVDVLRIPAHVVASIPDLDKRVIAFTKAVRDHAFTEGVPAPVEDALIMEIAARGGYEIVPDPEPAPAPVAGPDAYAALGRLVEVLTRAGVIDADAVAAILGLPEADAEADGDAA